MIIVIIIFMIIIIMIIIMTLWICQWGVHLTILNLGFARHFFTNTNKSPSARVNASGREQNGFSSESRVNC